MNPSSLTLNLEYPKHVMLNMPALSPTMTQGNLGAWKKKIGDPVSPGDVLVEIETDKAQMEMECQEEGFLAKILLPEGTKEAPVGKPMAIIVDKKEDVEKFKSFKVEEQLEAPKKEEQVSTEKATANITPSIADHQPSNPSLTMADGRIKASPLAKSTAKDLNVNLSGVVGTGPNGRIVNADVMSAKPAVATPGSSFVDIPLSNMRRVIAQRLTDSKQTIPHYYLTVDISMDQLTELRERLNKHNAGRFKISVNDFIIKAAARAMSDVPEVNSAWYGTFIRQYQHADISVAVATEAGLITPIIKQANLKGLEGIANEMKELVGKARENKLKPEEFQGGSFTISNLGMFGVKHFTAIINPPQTCILAVGGTDRRIIPDENGVPTIVPMMTVTMSCDHRAVDGATGARWLQHFKRYMEDPITILL